MHYWAILCHLSASLDLPLIDALLTPSPAEAIKEALHIRLTDIETLLNRDEGVSISDCWAAILSHTHSLTSVASSSTHQR